MTSEGSAYREATVISPARTVALAVLLSCQHTDHTVDELIDQQLGQVTADFRDRALAMELVYGVLRRQETLDWRVAPLLKKPLERLPFVIQMLIRMGAYQLLYLNRIPPSAAVDESVRITRSYRSQLGRDWTGFVNAVLRNLLRVPEPRLPDSCLRSAQGLSVRYALPLWLCERWIEQLGFDQAEAACRTVSDTPLVTLRVNQRRITREAFLARLQERGMSASVTTVSPVGLILEKGHHVTSLPGFEEGEFYVEDEAAQLIPPLLDPQPGEIILDACAAPGGKTSHLVELMANHGHIVAMDRHDDRVARLRENCARMGATIVRPLVGDARRTADVLRRVSAEYGPSPHPFELVDRVLLDAPCSGLGVLRRHPEGKGKKHTSMFARHQAVQRELLEAVSIVLRPGGVLVYSTCSTEREETEDVVGHFCRLHQEYTRESVAPWLPPAARSFLTAHGALSTMGNDCGMDGFYAARLRKVC